MTTQNISREEAFGFRLDSGDERIAFILRLAEAAGISDRGIDKTDRDQIRQVKTNFPWIAPGIYPDGARLLKDTCPAVGFMALDLDGTRLTDQQISQIFRNYEYLQYTTISDVGNCELRRLRVMIPYSRIVTNQEHARLVKHFVYEMEQECPVDLNLDSGKLLGYCKFFVPHLESQVIWAKKKNGRKTILMPVDDILAQIPKEPRIPPIQESQVLWLTAATATPEAAESAQEQQRLDEIQAIIATMTPGDRSLKAVQIGGRLKRIAPQHHTDIFNQLRAVGVEEGAIRQAKIYSKRI